MFNETLVLNFQLNNRSITDIIRDFVSYFAASDYLDRTVSNKKAPATLDTVHK